MFATGLFQLVDPGWMIFTRTMLHSVVVPILVDQTHIAEKVELPAKFASFFDSVSEA
jgi:hypothetical protein